MERIGPKYANCEVITLKRDPHNWGATARWWFLLIMDQWRGAYRQVSNIRRTLVCNKIVDHSDVVGASPVGAAPTTSSFST